MTDSDKIALKKASKTPLLDGQYRWYELLSPTLVLTGAEKLDHDMNQQQQIEGETKKKMNEETMNRMDQDMTVPNDGQHDMQKEEEKEGQLERMEVSCHLS